MEPNRAYPKRTSSWSGVPRVGIDFASEADRARPWRFAEAGSAWVTQVRKLTGTPPSEG